MKTGKEGGSKYQFSEPVKLQSYYVGEDLDESRAVLEQYAVGIINLLAEDSLPGITAGKITVLGDLLQQYKDSQTSQTDEQSSATNSRQGRNAQIRAIAQRRRTIQFAADAEWPWTDPANAAIRKKFLLPLDRPFRG